MGTTIIWSIYLMTYVLLWRVTERRKAEETQDKISLIYATLENLPIDQKILFDLIYNQGYNTSSKLQLYYKNNMPKGYKVLERTSCWKQMCNLKNMLTSGATQTN